jgi:hypothetical protein
LAALLHAARHRDALDVTDVGSELPRPIGARTAVFDGAFFDATTGKEIPGTGLRAKTMWGWIAWSLGGEIGYNLLREQDEARVAPGADEILNLLGDNANLILLDEVLQYLISTGGIRVDQTTLRDETLTFLQRLTTAVSNAKNTALIFTLQSSKRESLDYVGLLQAVDHLAARKDQRREPVEGNEILQVIQRRLLSKPPDTEASSAISTAYQETVSQMRRAYAKTAAEQEQADQEGLRLRDRIRSSYPFHPALIDLMRERWAAIPDFQRTRGALRFLAACLRAAHRAGKSRYLLGPGDVLLADAEVRLAFFKEVGQQADYQAVLEHDFIGANSRTRLIDDRRAKETPADAIRRPATRLATAILMYSFGGLRREGTAEGELLPPGITESELLSICVGPDLDTTTAQACLKELKEQCLYLHFDGARYCFKKDPNVTLLVEQEVDSVARDERRVRERIKEMLEARLAGHRDAIVWPEKSGYVPDGEPTFLTVYMPLEFAAMAGQDSEALVFLEHCGDKSRKFRNGLAIAIPSVEQVEVLRRGVRYLLAIDQIKAKAKQLNLTDEQRSQLREREATEVAGIEAAFLRLYLEVWFPKPDNGTISLEKVAVGGRPLQTTLNQKKHAMIHERIMELVTVIQPRLFSSLKPTKIVELFRLGEGDPPTLGLRVADIVDGFFSFLGFTRLTNAGIIRKAIAKGIQESAFGYFSGQLPVIAPDGKFAVSEDRVRFGVPVAEDEVDLESGFLIWPSALPQAANAIAPAVSPLVDPVSGTQVATHSVVPEPPPSLPIKAPVEVKFTANRNQLFVAWNAIANLADICGTVAVTVRGESDISVDGSRLQNGVMEPLQEAGLL